MEFLEIRWILLEHLLNVIRVSRISFLKNHTGGLS
jgi:hypothetical protein